MRKSKVINILGAFIGLLILALGIISYHYFQQIKEDNEQWERFVNHLYFAIDRSIEGFDYLIDYQPKDEELTRRLHGLERDLLKADAVLYHAHSYLSSDLYYTDFFQSSTFFLYGISMTGTVTATIPPIGEDNQLNEKELALLTTIRDYLLKAKQEMYSDLTKQENPDLTLSEINDIIKKYLNYDTTAIYKDASE